MVFTVSTQWLGVSSLSATLLLTGFTPWRRDAMIDHRSLSGVTPGPAVEARRFRILEAGTNHERLRRIGDAGARGPARRGLVAPPEAGSHSPSREPARSGLSHGARLTAVGILIGAAAVAITLPVALAAGYLPAGGLFFFVPVHFRAADAVCYATSPGKNSGAS